MWVRWKETLTKSVHRGDVCPCPLSEKVTVMHLIAIAWNLEKRGYFFFTEKCWAVSPVLGIKYGHRPVNDVSFHLIGV